MSIPSNWVMFLMFKPLILSNIAICWGAFPWFSMVLEIPSFPPRQRQAPKVFLLLCTADPYHLPGSLPSPGSPYPLRSRASPPHLPGRGENISRSPPHPPSTDSYRVAGNDTGFKIGQLRFFSHNILFVTVTVFYQNPQFVAQTWLINTILMVRLPVQGWAKSMLKIFGKVWHFHE